MKLALLPAVCALLLAGCAGSPKLDKPFVPGNLPGPCQDLWLRSEVNPPERALATVSTLFRESCDHEVLALAALARDRFRDKVYRLTDEGWKFVGVAESTDYVLEGYERTYLSLLIARSHLRLGDTEAAAIELRRANDEQKARIYNQSEDALTMAIQAGLWENLNEPSHARAAWRRTSESPRATETVRDFARAQIRRLDRGGKASTRRWLIEERGLAPDVDFKFVSPSLSKSYYELVPKSPYPPDCALGEELLVASTKPWFDELAERNLSEKRTLEYAQGVTRGLLGLTWSVVGVGTGVALGLVGCAHSGSTPDACESAIQLGVIVAGLGLQATEDHIAPDRRRWENLPASLAFISSEAPKNATACRPPRPTTPSSPD